MNSNNFYFCFICVTYSETRMYPKEMINIVRDFYNNNNYSIRDVKKIFKITKTFIHRWINNIYDVVKNKIVSNYDLICTTITDVILKNPFITLKSIQTEISKTINKNISISGIYVYLKKLNITYKKVSKQMYSNVKDLNKKIREFKKIIKKIKLKNVVCLDESYVQTNMSHEYGWSKTGKK